MAKVFFIDPQSYGNLSLYDSGVLCQMKDAGVTFFGNRKWDCAPLDGIESHLIFNYSDKTNSISKVASYVKSLTKIAKLIKRKKPNVVHVEWIRLFAIDWIFLKYLHSKGIKVVYTAHNILPHDTGEKYKSQFKKYYHTVDSIIVHSHRTKRELIEMFNLPEDKITVIPHGIITLDVDSKTVASSKQNFQSDLQLDGKIVFSSLGIQSTYKGIDNLVKVWSETPELRNNPNIKLLLIGQNNGIDYSPIENLKNVFILNERISNEDFQAYTQLSDIILLPYKQISQSGVLFTAIDNNIPVLVGDVGGLAEPLAIGNIGWNIGNPSIESLKKQLLYLVTHPEEVQSIKNNKSDFDKVKQHYSWYSISIATKALYQKV